VSLKYERLSDLFYRCGCLGHGRDRCTNKVIAKYAGKWSSEMHAQMVPHLQNPSYRLNITRFPQHVAPTVTHLHHKSTQRSSSSTSPQPPVTDIHHFYESIHFYEPVSSSSPCKENISTATPLVCSNYYVTEPPESTFSPTPSIPLSMTIDVSLAAALSKAPVWDAIVHRSSSYVETCLIIGDFNLIGELSDKIGGSSGLHHVEDALENINLFEACPFQSVLHKPVIGSDHAPLIYSSHPTHQRKRSSFRFESLWMTHEECENTIRGSWPTLVAGNHLLGIMHNLSNVLDHVMSESMNIHLQSPVIDSEIHTAKMQLGGLKALSEDGFPAGSRDRPPMLATGRYPQWRSRFLQYTDTRPNDVAAFLVHAIGNAFLVHVVAAADDSPAIPEHTIVETPMNMMMNFAGARENVDSPVVQQSRIQCFNCKEFGHFAKECRKLKRVKDFAYHKEKMLLCKQAEKGVPLQAEQYDWLADTDEEIDEQEFEAHYSYMAKIQEVPTADPGTDSEPLEQVQNNSGYNVFANDLQHSEQSESVSNTCLVETDDSNVIPDSPDMCDDDIQNDQNDVESDDERVVLANLIANLKLDVDENKKIQKQLKKANTTLAQELKECKTILAETSKTLRESNSVRDSCLVAIQNKQTEFEKYKAFNDRTIDYDKLERLVKQKTKVITDLKLKEEHDIDKMLSMEKQLKFLNEIVYKQSQSIQTIHMMAPKTCLMPLSLKTQNDSFIFVHELKQEMHADLKYVESLEKEIDELEFDKAEFLNMYDIILQKCVSNEVMCSYLLSLSDLDALAELQCLYLHKVKECDCLAQKLSKQTESVSN
nr:reverse transcriptase [Tanacetum cinerariifolium]